MSLPTSKFCNPTRRMTDFRIEKEDGVVLLEVILSYCRRLNKNIRLCEHIAQPLLRILEVISASEDPEA